MLPEFFQKLGALRHELLHERQREIGLFAHEGADAYAAEMECLRLDLRPRLTGVAARPVESFAAEGLARRRDPRHEAAPDAHLIAEHHLPRQDDEDAIAPGASLVDAKTGWPRGTSAECGEGLELLTWKPCGLPQLYRHYCSDR